MLISGFQKTSLLDYPEKVAAIIFTTGCNLRCPWCHNAGIVKGKYDNIEEKEIFDYLEKRKGILDGVVITGGEPLLQPDLIEFMGKIKSCFGLNIKLDTNGVLTDKLERTLKSGYVDYVAMDVKGDLENYYKFVGLTSFDASAIAKSIDVLEKSNIPHEFRTTCIKGLTTPQTVKKAASLVKDAKNYFLQNFVDSGDILDSHGFGSFSPSEMQELLEIAKTENGNTVLRGV